MLIDRVPGRLIEPLTGRVWERADVMRELACRMAIYQDWGIGPSERVLMHYGNCAAFFVDVLAIWCLGGCVIPIDPRFTPFEVGILAESVQPSYSLWLGAVSAEIVASLEGLDITIRDTSVVETSVSRHRLGASLPHDIELNTPALMLFTSGTTGSPKGVVHTHRSLRARWLALYQGLGLTAFQRTLCLLPTHFGHGLICNGLYPWLAGRDLFVMPSFDSPSLLQLGEIIDRCAVTCLSSVPAVWRLVLKLASAPKAGTLQRVFCGSAPLSAEMWRDIQRWSGTKEVFNVYGITEVGSWVAGISGAAHEPETGLIGEPWGTIIDVSPSKDFEPWSRSVDGCGPGESGYLWLNTPGLMQGYFSRDDLTRQVVQHGWFFTGDIGYRDDRGRLYLRGREREEINKGGMKVYPSDIDAVIERFEAVADVCSFGYDGDPLYEHNVGVAIALHEWATHDVLDVLYRWTQRHVAAYQMPQRWYILDTIPRTSRGKVNRADVAKFCSTLVPQTISSVVG